MSATNPKTTIIDNNLLRLITKNESHSLYEKFWTWANNNQLIDADTQIALTPSGILEYLGQKMPKVALPDGVLASLVREANELSKIDPMDSYTFNLFRHKVLSAYEEKLKTENLYSKSKFSGWIGIQKTFTSPYLRDWIFKILSLNLDLKGRQVVYNRVAIDRAFSFNWPAELEQYYFAALLADLVQCFDYKVGFGTMRGLSRLWKDFSSITTRRINSGDKLGSLTPAEQLDNIKTVNTALSFDSDGDFLDVEAIHYLVVGKYKNDELKPITFFTQDPVDKFLLRIAMMKSLLVLAFQMAKKDDAAEPPSRAGIAVIFDIDVNVIFRIPIEKVDPLISVIGDVKISDWLKTSKDSFKV